MADKVAKRTIVRQTTYPSDGRPNIPTAEIESFARPEEKSVAIVRYPRDPTRDALALIEELRAESEGRRSEQQLGFLGPCSELSFEESGSFNVVILASSVVCG